MTLTFPFLDAIHTLPALPRKDASERGFSSLAGKIRQMENTDIAGQWEAITAHPQGKALLDCIFAYSPFLSRLIGQHTAFFIDYCTRGVDACFTELKMSLVTCPSSSTSELMKALRIAKSKASLLIASADLGHIWSLEQVTLAMSEIAELCVHRTVEFLLTQAHKKGDITLPHPENPEQESGLFVLAMGKLGSRALNYSSDIDLIVFFDSDRTTYTGAQNSQKCFSKMAQEMMHILQERTADGYVFRVDLRLRPDPASTPLAMSVAGAITYYETVGQNWERAALIKARPIAGDTEAGYQFLNQIRPFIWRKHLDFAAIEDIQSIKRQMDARTGTTIDLPGHNIKTGIGGIREIEFFAQIHQLIWGGRMPTLRLAGTCKTLKVLAEMGLISAELAEQLSISYRFLRSVEHHLQMIDDQQTHSIPTSPEAIVQLAAFMGFTEASFMQTLLGHLHFVHEQFSSSFRGKNSLSSDEGKLSFTGVENDPQTLETIRKMGYQNPASVSEIIQAWHHGSRRATRTKRARELITELTPTLLKALAATSQPDQAFIHFDEFLTRLPAGIQLFSLFSANPQLLDLIAIIMGSAPAMAESLSKNPLLLDTLLTADFLDLAWDEESLFNELANILLLTRDFEDEMDAIRRFKNEKQFETGVQLLRQQISLETASQRLSDIAQACIIALLHRVEVELAKKQPELHQGGLAIIALGRLGARTLTFGSDIDLVFIYDTPPAETALTGDHSLYNKLCQRFITSLTTLTREGRLYEVDTRLRPSGLDGALAVSVSAFDKYFSEAAWTFEFMALTRARVIAGPPATQQQLNHIINRHLTQPRDPQKLKHDIVELRSKITKEFGSNDPWNLKYAHGGLMDIDFLAQYFILLHAPMHADIITSSTEQAFHTLINKGLIAPETGHELVNSYHFLNALFALLRLCGGGIINETTAPHGLKQLIAKTLDKPDFDTVKTTLITTLASVQKHFKYFIHS